MWFGNQINEGTEMKKIAFVLILAAFAGILLYGCGEEKGKASSMSPETAYSNLVEISEKVYYCKALLNILDFDKETIMPRGGAEYRGKVVGFVTKIGHDLVATDDYGNLLEVSEKGDWGEWEKANLRLWRRQYDIQRKLPADFVEKEAAAISEAYTAWEKAREQNDPTGFIPQLEKVFELQKERADFLGYDEHPYDALLDLYIPGMTTAKLEELFADLKPFVIDLARRIGESEVKPDFAKFESIRFDSLKQKEFVLNMTSAVGFDYHIGYLGETPHPITLNLGLGDVRITDSFQRKDILWPFTVALHEGGHGIYEQGLPAKYYGQPVGESMSMDIHESQSRFYENHMGRSPAFWSYWLPRLEGAFPSEMSGIGLDEFCLYLNRVQPSLIRIEADEVTYSLHVIIRFEIERDVMAGKLAVKDIPEEWNRKYKEYLGVEPPDYSTGFLQDLHWSQGYVGYFPSYVLGSMNAAQLYATLEKEQPDIEEKIADGEFIVLRDWLRERIHKWGNLYMPEEIIEKATGEKPNAKYYIDYLGKKYGALYKLDEI